MRSQKIKGPFCRTCGIALVRSQTTKTLWQGWWSPISLVYSAPRTLVLNLLVSRELEALPLPEPAASGAAPLPVGKQVRHRPLAYVGLIPLVWAVWFVVSVIILYA